VGISGDEFAERALLQAQRFDTTLLVPSTAVALTGHDGRYRLTLDSGDEIGARSMIIATGVTYRKLDVAGLGRFDGVSVFYTPLTARDELDPGQPVVIVGGGNSAGQAATALAGHGHPVTIVIRTDDLAETMSRYLVDRLNGQPLVTVLPHTAVVALDGADRLDRVVVEDLLTSAHQTIPAGTVFVLIGAEPHTGWLADSIDLDADGYILTGPALSRSTRRTGAWRNLDRDPSLLETSLPGVFAAGDVRSGSIKRVASAAGEGSIAALLAREFLKTGRTLRHEFHRPPYR
jgi:thioredoxin reductase (NADPH)